MLEKKRVSNTEELTKAMNYLTILLPFHHFLSGATNDGKASSIKKYVPFVKEYVNYIDLEILELVVPYFRSDKTMKAALASRYESNSK